MFYSKIRVLIDNCKNCQARVFLLDSVPFPNIKAFA